MDENELIKEAFSYLDQGAIEAAELRFEEYMGRRVQVGDAAPLREMWEKFAAKKREEMEQQRRAEEGRKRARLRNLLFGE